MMWLFIIILCCQVNECSLITISLASFHQITKLVFLTCVQSTVLAHLSEEVCVVIPWKITHFCGPCCIVTYSHSTSEHFKLAIYIIIYENCLDSQECVLMVLSTLVQIYLNTLIAFIHCMNACACMGTLHPDITRVKEYGLGPLPYTFV